MIMKKIHKIYFIVAYIFVIIFCMVGCNNETNHVVTTIKPTIPVSTIDTTDIEHVEATAQPNFDNATKHLAQEIHKTIGDDDTPENAIQRYLANKLFICEVYIPEGLSEYEGENQEIAFIWGEQYSIDTKFDSKTYRGNPILVEFSKDKKKIIDIKIPNKLGDMNEQMEEIFGEKVLIDLSDSYNDEMYSQKSLKVSKKISDIALSGGFQVNLTNDVYKLWLELHNNGYFSGETIENAIFKYYADNYFFNINQFAIVSWYEHFRQETDVRQSCIHTCSYLTFMIIMLGKSVLLVSQQ
jgi:hypothetical protein